MNEDEEENLRVPVKKARGEKGGQGTISDLLRKKFDDITNLETKLAKDKENRDTQKGLGRARTVYDFVRKYAAETASKQEGLTAEEKKKLEQAATAGSEPQVVEIDPNEAAELEKQVAEQRAKEKAAIKAAVDKANAEVAAAKKAQEEAEKKKAAAKKKKEDADAQVKALMAALAAKSSSSRRRML